LPPFFFVDKIFFSIYALQVMEPEDKSKKQIGIKLADGHFYPVFPEDFKGKRKLVLTTVRDNQQNVQIDLFKGSGEVLYEDSYIGSLVIENIEEGAKGEPEIELNIGIDENGNLSATAFDAKSGEKQSLSVSLESVSEEDMYTIPEFEINQEEEQLPPSEEEVEMQAQTVVEESSPQTMFETKVEREEKRKGNPLLLLLFIFLGLVVIAAAGWGVYSLLKGTPFIPGLQVSGTQTSGRDESMAKEEQPKQEAAEDTAQSEDRTADKQAAEDQETTQTETSDTGKGEEYVVVWGDTLWDIARRYYRDPFEYKMIAKVNKIQNPDLIFAKQKIFLPAK